MHVHVQKLIEDENIPIYGIISYVQKKCMMAAQLGTCKKGFRYCL